MANKERSKCFCTVIGCDSAKDDDHTLSYHKPSPDIATYNKWCIALKVRKVPTFSYDDYGRTQIPTFLYLVCQYSKQNFCM